MTRIFDELGWVDVYRRLHPDATDTSYTWWSNRGQARAKNVGWRIDYQIATPGIAERAKDAAIYKDQWFSDHAPLTIRYGSQAIVDLLNQVFGAVGEAVDHFEGEILKFIGDAALAIRHLQLPARRRLAPAHAAL